MVDRPILPNVGDVRTGGSDVTFAEKPGQGRARARSARDPRDDGPRQPAEIARSEPDLETLPAAPPMFMGSRA